MVSLQPEKIFELNFSSMQLHPSPRTFEFLMMSILFGAGGLPRTRTTASVAIVAVNPSEVSFNGSFIFTCVQFNLTKPLWFYFLNPNISLHLMGAAAGNC